MPFFKFYQVGTTASPGELVRTELELPIEANRILGIQLVSDIPEQLFRRGRIEMMINGKEILPEGFHCQLLMCGANLSPSERWFKTDLLCGDRKVKLKLLDVNNPLSPFSSYVTTIYFLLEE